MGDLEGNSIFFLSLVFKSTENNTEVENINSLFSRNKNSANSPLSSFFKSKKSIRELSLT